MGGRVVEGTGLENRQARKRLVGSNPTPSATLFDVVRRSRQPQRRQGGSVNWKPALFQFTGKCCDEFVLPCLNAASACRGYSEQLVCRRAHGIHPRNGSIEGPSSRQRVIKKLVR